VTFVKGACIALLLIDAVVWTALHGVLAGAAWFATACLVKRFFPSE
jgi:hypothetical protein